MYASVLSNTIVHFKGRFCSAAGKLRGRRVRPPDATRQTPQPLSQSLKRCSNHECYVSAIETCLRLAISTMSGNSRCRLRRRTRRRNENGLLAAFSKTAALPGLSSCARNTPSGKRSTAGTRRALPSSQHAACPCPYRTRWPKEPHAQPAAGTFNGHGSAPAPSGHLKP